MSAGRILVTGASGRLGKATLALLGARGRAAFRAGPAARDAIIIPSDGAVDPSHLQGIEAIINCAGRVEGSPAELDQANVTYPVTLARAARQAGVARFVQVSSFSIYGPVEHIGEGSLPAPTTLYGHSKVEAEGQLRNLRTPDFTPVALRLPFMFSVEHPALMGRLVDVMLRLGALPTRARETVRRSMISYDGAADALIRQSIAPEPAESAIAAADPQPLALKDIAQAIRESLGRRVLVLPVPEPIVSAVRRIAPSIATRLFTSNVLDASANALASGTPFPVAAELHRFLEHLREKD